MNVISSQYLKEESHSSATYTIVIQDLREKLAKSTVGEGSRTEEFYVNWSKFSIELFIAGLYDESQGYLNLYLNNKSDWTVRTKFEVSVKVMVGLGNCYIADLRTRKSFCLSRAHSDWSSNPKRVVGES